MVLPECLRQHLATGSTDATNKSLRELMGRWKCYRFQRPLPVGRSASTVKAVATREYGSGVPYCCSSVEIGKALLLIPLN
jgi:hypothetical protein